LVLPSMIRVLVCGGRNFENRAMLYATLDRLHAARGFTVVIAGGARGADTLAVEWAKGREVMVEVYMADWDQFRRKAGPIRNGDGHCLGLFLHAPSHSRSQSHATDLFRVKQIIGEYSVDNHAGGCPLIAIFTTVN
jgi:YspA, cpYpsA-related SLOG family